MKESELHLAIERAAGELPEGYSISIDIENGYGGVTLCGFGDEDCIERDDNETFTELVLIALRIAKKRAMDLHT